MTFDYIIKLKVVVVASNYIVVNCQFCFEIIICITSSYEIIINKDCFYNFLL